MARKTQLIFFTLIIFALVFEPFLPIGLKQTFLAISLTLKSLIVFILPFLIFSLIFHSCSSLADHASKIIFFSLGLICFSNFISTYFGCLIGRMIYGSRFSIAGVGIHETLQPLFRWELSSPFDCKMALFAGIGLGILLPRHWPRLAGKMRRAVEKFATFSMALLIRIIPPFIFGYVLKLKFDGSISLLLNRYLFVFLIVAVAQFFLIFLYYLVANRFRLARVKVCIRQMIPAAVCAFTSMSSAATLPYSMEAVQRNVKNRSFIQSILPLSVNIHLVGNNVAIPILAFALLGTYGFPLPSGTGCLLFVLASVITKFSVVAVPGGGMIVMLPVLEKLFGFDSAMSSLILSLHLLFNPLLTTTNVLANGAFVQLLERILRRRSKRSLGR